MDVARKNNQRIVELNDRDPNRPEENAANRADVIAELLSKRRRELRMFISQIAKAASKNMYASIVRIPHHWNGCTTN